MCSSAGSFKKLVIYTALLLVSVCSGARFVFRDVQCKINDPKLAGVIYCRLERNERNVNTLSMRFRNSGAWCNETTGTLKYMRKVSANRYVNYIAPLNFDMCKFVGDEYNLLLRIVLRAANSYTNFNHPCPIKDSELYIDKFPITENLLFWMPVQKGDYMIFHNYILNNVSIVDINIYLRLQN